MNNDRQNGAREWKVSRYALGLLAVLTLIFILVVQGCTAAVPRANTSTSTPKPPSSGSTTNVEYTLTVVDTVFEPGQCIGDLSMLVPGSACIHNRGDEPLVLGNIRVEPGAEWCQERDDVPTSNDGAWLSCSHSGISFDIEDGIKHHLLTEDILTVELPDPQAELEEVSVVFHDILWAMEDEGDGIPIVIVPLKDDGGGTFDPYKNFKFTVKWDNTPSNTLDVHPIIDPDTGEVIGPIIVVFGNPQELQRTINGNSPGPAVIDFVEVSGGRGLGEGEPIAMLLLLVPSDQVLPDPIPPLCDPGAVALPEGTQVSTEEPPDSSQPVSTEEPTEEATGETPHPVCGDLVCDPTTENSDICPTDCQCVDDGVCSPGEGTTCRDCGSDAGTCGAPCSDSSQCAEGLACAGGVCWETGLCGGSDGGSCGYGECGCVPDVSNEEADACIFIFYDSCGNTETRNVCDSN